MFTIAEILRIYLIWMSRKETSKTQLMLFSSSRCNWLILDLSTISNCNNEFDLASWKGKKGKFVYQLNEYYKAMNIWLFAIDIDFTNLFLFPKFRISILISYELKIIWQCNFQFTPINDSTFAVHLLQVLSWKFNYLSTNRELLL